MSIAQNVVDLFWSETRVGAPNECWEWQGCRKKNGYGYLGKSTGRLYAHRISFEVSTGHPPGAFFVCHRCDNPGCVNPAHLFLGTAADNADDRGAKGRSAKGSKIGTALLRDAVVLQIRAAEGTQKEIAARFGTSRSNVSLIKRRVRWGWLNELETA